VLHWFLVSVSAVCLIASPVPFGSQKILPPSPDFDQKQAEASSAHIDMTEAAAESAADPGNKEAARLARQAEEKYARAAAAARLADSPGPDTASQYLGFLRLIVIAFGSLILGRAIRYVLAGE
jgi:hypothetical protein